MRPLSLATLIVALAVLGMPRTARAVDPAEAGEMAAEIEDKEKQVKEKFGNRGWREMDQSERKDYEKAMNGARDEVLEKHHTSLKDFEKGKLKMGKEGLSKSEESKKGWGDKQKKAAEEKKAAEDAKKNKEPEIEVQKGFNEKDPKSAEKFEGVEIPVPKDEGGAQP
jgi:hypothetical protein